MVGPGIGGGIRSVSAAVHAAPIPLKHASEFRASDTRLFVTISREAGAGGRTIGQALVNRLNLLDARQTPWTLWDRDLVEKAAADHNVSKELVESLGEGGRSWVEEFLSGLSHEAGQTEARTYQAVATTIRALAQKGRAVLVGRGGVYITRNMPGGIHVRLVAPMDYRIRYMAGHWNVSYADAESRVHELDRQRMAFYRRYWPREIIAAESFTITLNTAMVDESRAVESIIPLILNQAQATMPAAVPEPDLAAT